MARPHVFLPPPVLPDMGGGDPASIAQGLSGYAPSALRSSGYTPPPIGGAGPAEDPTHSFGDLGRGANSGFQGALANIQAYGAALADSMGFRDFAEGQYQSALRRQAQAQAVAPGIATTDQIGGWHDAARYATGAIGGAAGSLLPVGVAGLVGGTPGVVASMVPMSGGDVALRHRQALAAGDPNAASVRPWETLAASTGQGLLSSALAAPGVMSVVGKGPLARVMSQSTKGMNPAEAFAARTAATIAANAAGEGGEELSAQGATAWLHDQPFEPDMHAVKEAAIQGGVGMAPFALGHGLSGGVGDAGGAAAALAKAGIGKGTALAGEAAQSAPAQGLRKVAGEAMERGRDVAEGVRKNYDMLLDAGGEQNPSLTTRAANAATALKNNAPVAGEAIKRTAQDAYKGLKEAVAGSPDEPGSLFDKHREVAKRLSEGKGLTADDAKNPNVMYERGQTLYDMASRLRRRSDLTPEDRATAEAVLKLSGRHADILRATAKDPALAKGISDAYMRALDRDQMKKVDDWLEMTKRPLESGDRVKSVDQLTPGTEELLNSFLREAGLEDGTGLQGEVGDYPALPYESVGKGQPQVQRTASRERPLPSVEGRESGVPLNAMEAAAASKLDARVSAPSPLKAAIWGMFDEGSRDVGHVESLVRGATKMMVALAKGEVDLKSGPAKEARAALINLASTPEAKAQLAEFFAKAQQLSEINLQDKKGRQRFVKELGDMVSKRQLPLTTALQKLSNRHAAPGVDKSPEGLRRWIDTYQTLADNLYKAEPHQQQALALQLASQIDRQFGAANRKEVMAILDRLGGRREETNPASRAAEMDPFREEANIPDEHVYGGEDEEPTKAFREVPIREAEEDLPIDFGHTVFDAEGPKSPYPSFRNARSELERAREDVKMTAPHGRAHTVTVQERLQERAMEHFRQTGELLDTEREATHFRDQALKSSADDADAARQYLDGRKIDADKLVAKAREASLKLASESAGTDEAKIAASADKFKSNDFFKKFVDEDAARALASVFWHDVRATYADTHSAQKFFETFKYRFPSVRDKMSAEAETFGNYLKEKGTTRIWTEEVGAKASDGDLVVRVPGEDTEIKTVVSLPKLLETMLHAEDRPLSKKGVLWALSKVAEHFADGEFGKLTPESERAFGFGKGQMDPNLLLLKLKSGTEIRGRDLAKEFGDKFSASSLRPEVSQRILTPADRAAGKLRLKAADGQTHVVDLPAAVRKAAAARGATEDNIRRLNKAQLAAAADRVLDELEAQYPGFKREKMTADTVLATREKYNGKKESLRLADMEEFGLQYGEKTSREGSTPMEYDMSPEKTTERNTQGYLDRLRADAQAMLEQQKLTAEERAKLSKDDWKALKLPRSPFEEPLMSAKQAVLGVEQMIARAGRKGDEHAAAGFRDMLAKYKERVDDLRAKDAAWLADQLDQMKTSDVRVDSSGFENKGVRPGQNAADLPESGSKHARAGESGEGLRLPRVREGEAPEDNSWPRTPAELGARIRQVYSDLESRRFGNEDFSDVPSEHSFVAGKVARATRAGVDAGGRPYEAGDPIRRVGLGDSYATRDNERIASRLTDEEQEVVPVHNPLAPKRTLKNQDAIAESDAWLAAQKEKELAGGVPEEKVSPSEQAKNMLAIDKEWVDGQLADKSVHVSEIVKALDENLDAAKLEQIASQLPKGLRANKLKSEIEKLVEKKLSETESGDRFLSVDRIDHEQDALEGHVRKALHQEFSDLMPEAKSELQTSATARATREAGWTEKQANEAGKYVSAVSEFTKNPFGVMRHEMLHNLVRILNESEQGRKIVATLLKAIEKHPMEKKAIDLLTRHMDEQERGDLIAHLNSHPEEKLAYMYQLRKSGLLDVFNPPVEGFFAKITRVIRNVLQMTSSRERADNFLKWFEKGEFKLNYDNPDVIQRAMGQKGLDRAMGALDTHLKPIAKAVTNLFTPGMQQLLESNNPHMKKLAEMYGAFTGQEGGRMGVVHERDRGMRMFENEVSPIIENLDKAARGRLVAELAVGEPTSDAGVALAKVFEARGVRPDAKVYDLNRIADRWEEFSTDLRNHGTVTGPINSGALRAALAQAGMEYPTASTAMPTFRFATKDANGKWLPQTERQKQMELKWQKQNFEDYVGTLIRQTETRKARDAAFGPGGEKLAELIQKIRESGGDVALAEKFIGGAEGWLGADMDPKWRSVQGAVITGLNLFHLPYAVLSAMVDPIYIAARSGDVTEAFKAWGTSLRSLKDTFNKEGRQTGAGIDFATELGHLAQDGLADPMANFFSAMSLDGASRKVNKTFFRYNFLQGVERQLFGAAAKAGERFLLRHAKQNDELSQRLLGELGLTAKDIETNKDGSLKFSEAHGLSKEQAQKIQNALYQFAHESVARPTAVSNATWMNDPQFALLAHMKRFILAQSNGILSYLERQGKAQYYAPMLIAAAAMPVQLAVDSARNILTGGRTMDTSPVGIMVRSFFESGLGGRADFAYDFVNHAMLGGNPITPVLGPAAMDFEGIVRNIAKGSR